MEQPEQLYHYTSPDVVLKILQGGSMWATMIHYMNDAQELQYAFSLAREILTEETQQAAPGLDSTRLCDEFFDVISNVAVFAISFSQHRDQLSQWRAYCPPEGGYSIGFNTTQLQSVAQMQGFRLARCVYDRDSQLAMLRPIVREMVDAATQMAHGIDLYDSFANRFTSIGAVMKHPSFEEEHEWRLISDLGHDWRSIDYRATNSLIVPYCKLKFATDSTSPISVIVVGPNRHSELAGRSLRLLTSALRGWPMKIERSESPFRILR